MSTVFSGALMISSREVFQVETDDFIRYFDLYQSLHTGDLEKLFSYGGGLEILTPSLLAAIGLFGPKDSPQFVLFFLCLFCTFTFYLWLEYRGLDSASIDEGNKAACIGASLLLFSLFNTTQIVRQTYAVVVMLYALTAQSRSHAALFLTIAGGFHLSAIPVFLSIITLRRIKYYGLIPLALILWYFDLTTIEEFILQGESQGGARLGWLLSSESVSVWLYGIFIMSVLAILFLTKNTYNRNAGNWKFPVLAFCLIYFAFLQVPGASFRLCLMFISVIPGYLIFSALLPYAKYARILFLIVLAQRTYKSISTPSSEGLWSQFERWGAPFYFLF
ncbi:hypothetical protein [Sphaerotilus mobilis]|uniref:hypothetical protein n=1 Tax=Sphaerotilus mobilis TaxID=47994 RepID=UPI00102C4020|nr:hypothetical protein [Sphaerotilus mobilis]